MRPIEIEPKRCPIPEQSTPDCSGCPHQQGVFWVHGESGDRVWIVDCAIEIGLYKGGGKFMNLVLVEKVVPDSCPLDRTEGWLPNCAGCDQFDGVAWGETQAGYRPYVRCGIALLEEANADSND